MPLDLFTHVSLSFIIYCSLTNLTLIFQQLHVKIILQIKYITIFINNIFRSHLQGKTSHKFIDMSENSIMRIYYTNRLVLFFMCAGNEAFYAALYVLHFTEGPFSK